MRVVATSEEDFSLKVARLTENMCPMQNTDERPKGALNVLFHHPYHQQAEKVNFRAETVVLLPRTSSGQ